MAKNNQETRCKYWATHSSIRSFARIGHSFAGSALLALLPGFAVLIHLLAHSLTHCQAHGKVKNQMLEQQAVLNHRVLYFGLKGPVIRSFDKNKYFDLDLL